MLRDEASFWAREELRSSLINCVLGLGMTSALYGCFKLPHEYKYLPNLVGVGFGVVGLANCKRGQEVQAASQDLQKVSEMARTTRYYEETKPDTVQVVTKLPESNQKELEVAVPLDYDSMHREAVKYANAGWNKPKIISKVWGYSDYQEGQAAWEQIESKLGQIVLLPQQE